jgi:AAA domain
LWSQDAVGIVGGEPKCCKSFLALDLAVAVAAGVPCLRRFAVPTPGRVLLYAAEDALARFLGVPRLGRQQSLSAAGGVVVHGLSQAFQKRGLPRASLSDNGPAMTAAEVVDGLTRLGVLQQTTLPYTPESNAKIEILWASVEGRLMAMLEHVADLSMARLNEATLAWVEGEYNRKVNSETGQTPIARFLAGPSVMRSCPDSAALRLAFTRTERRRQRKSDGTLVLEGRRFEVPDRYRHLSELEVRYAGWDLSHVHLVDERSGTVLCRLFPQNKAQNASGVRRTRNPEVKEPPVAWRLAERDSELRWLVTHLWSQDAVGIVGGEPKCCKSFLALDLAVAVAAGVPCLRRFAVPTPGRVLLYAAEDAHPIVRRRLEGIAAAAGVDLRDLDIQVITAPTLRLDLSADRLALQEAVAKLQPRLLILDPFVRLHRIDENASGEVAPLLAYLRELQRRYALAVLVVHHAKKGAGNVRAGQALRGSSEFHAWGDSNLYLRRDGDALTLAIEHRAAPALKPMKIELVASGEALALQLTPGEEVAVMALHALVRLGDDVADLPRQVGPPGPVRSLARLQLHLRLRHPVQDILVIHSGGGGRGGGGP